MNGLKFSRTSAQLYLHIHTCTCLRLEQTDQKHTCSLQTCESLMWWMGSEDLHIYTNENSQEPDFYETFFCILNRNAMF